MSRTRLTVLWTLFASAAAPAGDLASFSYDVAANATTHSPVVWVEFGHSSHDPNDKNWTIVKQLSYIPA